MRRVALLSRARTAIRIGLVALLLSAAMVLGPVAPAQAYSCSSTYHVRIDSGVSVLDYYFSPSCSDGLSHLRGTIYDTACDARQAKGWMFVQHQRHLDPGSTWYGVWNAQVYVDNGCGTSNTFDRSGPKPIDYVFDRWRVHSFTRAENRWGSSSSATYILYP